jgi:hypothetical protein
VAGKVLNLDQVISPDQLGCRIAQQYQDWDTFRAEKVREWEELRRYIFATDTTKTTNSKLPWKNKTTIPKLCQIRDNLHANYMASMFPKRSWLVWEADERASNVKEKREAIEAYMKWVVAQDHFKKEISKCVLDYIDYGNCFATVEWSDGRVELPDKIQAGYVGPVVRRISPIDLVMNPIAPSFDKAPKIVRSLVSLGEVKELLERLSTDENRQQYEDLYRYLREMRQTVAQHTGRLKTQDDYFNVDGFDSFKAYLESDYAELLTFYGDIYDSEKDEFLRNHVVVVVDRHKVVLKKPNPSFFGTAPIFHVGWRVRQDNLWAMGPLDNLVGMQYRIDHIENLKADVFDLITFPPLKVKGLVEDFEWAPFEKIFVGDDGDVEILAPPADVLQANLEIAQLEQKMEEMAGAPKEAMGFRTPGEKTKYEVQRLENAASRIFANKISQFEEQFVERLLNACLELARRNFTSGDIRIFDDELQFSTFQTLTIDDITGNGRIRPVAARHFAERADMIQNLNNFAASPLYADLKAHFSSIDMARMMETLLEIEDYELVKPYVRLAEEADAQRFIQSAQEQVMVEGMTPSGLSQDDTDEPILDEGVVPIE